MERIKEWQKRGKRLPWEEGEGTKLAQEQKEEEGRAPAAPAASPAAAEKGPEKDEQRKRLLSERAELMRKARTVHSNPEEDSDGYGWEASNRMTWVDWAVISVLTWGGILWMSGQELYDEWQKKKLGRVDEEWERERESTEVQRAMEKVRAEVEGEGWPADGVRESTGGDGLGNGGTMGG